MCDDEPEPILTSLGEDGLYGVCHVVLELIDIEEKILAIFFRHILSAKRCDLYLRHEDETEESRVQISDDTL